MSEFAAGPLTNEFWQAGQPIIDQIENLPFLRELLAGDLDAQPFVFYILQDDFYLVGYARAMAVLAAKAQTTEQRRFWAESVVGAIAAEEDMHQSLLADARLADTHRKLASDLRASPTTLAYVSWLEANAALRSYALGVAAVLPCFWVYAHVGKYLTRQAGHLADDHPYKAWIAMYDSPIFDAATRKAVNILEQCLAAADERERGQMKETFLQACTYEWHFWHAAHIMQGWQLPMQAGLSA